MNAALATILGEAEYQVEPKRVEYGLKFMKERLRATRYPTMPQEQFDSEWLKWEPKFRRLMLTNQDLRPDMAKFGMAFPGSFSTQHMPESTVQKVIGT